MGLEDRNIMLGLKDISAGHNLQEVKRVLETQGWKRTNFGFSLARHSGGIDVTRNNTRVLIYTGNEKDQESYRMLSANDLPVLDTEDATSSDLRITTIPTSARALDGMRFPEQQPVTGYLGAVEIMTGLAD